jgi:hypothetical protein
VAGEGPITIHVLAAYYEPLLGDDVALRAGRLFRATYDGAPRSLDLTAAPPERFDAIRTQQLLDQ